MGEFLVCYDYGQGGVWAYLRAETAAEIQAKYPELTLFETPPSWMGPSELSKLRASMVLDVNDEEHSFLRAIREGRRGKQQ
jgi:hypothetical protein